MNDEMRALKVLDRASGICLFTREWKWPMEAHIKGVDSLVASFTQFAREVDGGDVVRVQFEPKGSSRHGSRTSSPRAERGTGEPIALTAANGAVEMLSKESDKFQAVLFHDRTTESSYDSFQTFLQLVVDTFDKRYRDQVEGMRPQLQRTETSSESQRTQIQNQFEAFDMQLEEELLPTLARTA